MVWRPKDPSNSFHIWGPEIHYIKGKWYIYYTADDGNTDNHQLYVLENASLNPMNGSFQMKGRIVTDLKWNWGILASVFENKGKLYLLWSGWPRRRIYAENQCIYIAGMKNPWLNKTGVSSLRLYVSGTNLLTISNLSVMDPECASDNGLDYPPMRVINVGVNLKF